MNFSNSFHHSLPLCLQLTILQQRGRALGCSPGPRVAPGMKRQRSLRLRAQSGTGCEKRCVALKAKKLHEHPPQEGSGNIATLYLQKWRLLPGENPSAAALALVTRRHWLPGLFIQPTAVAQSAASQRKVV